MQRIFPLDNNIGFLLAKALQSMNSRFKSKFLSYGITTAQYGVLSRLWEENGPSQKELSERLYMDGATLTGVLDRMERNHLVIREKDTQDRRIIKVFLTKKGEELKEILISLAKEINEDATKEFSSEEVSQLKNLLLKIR